MAWYLTPIVSVKATRLTRPIGTPMMRLNRNTYLQIFLDTKQCHRLVNFIVIIGIVPGKKRTVMNIMIHSRWFWIFNTWSSIVIQSCNHPFLGLGKVTSCWWPKEGLANMMVKLLMKKTGNKGGLSSLPSHMTWWHPNKLGCLLSILCIYVCVIPNSLAVVKFCRNRAFQDAKQDPDMIMALKLFIQLSASITLSNMLWYYIHHCNDSSRT